jgi:hypothetical protein
MAPDTDRRSLRSLRSDRDDSKEREFAFYTVVSLRGHAGKTTLAYRQPPRLCSLEHLPQSNRFSSLSTFRVANDSTFRYYAIGIKEQVEVESQSTAT